ncbi:MAG: molybdopterin dinucleotide binding domain-containing protein [Enterocloster clostridioformis]
MRSRGLKGGFEFVMTCGNRSPVRYSSFGPNIEALAALDPYPTADIDPADAGRLEIEEEGCRVDVETAFGTKRFRARITPMHPGTIHVFSGGGSSLSFKGSGGSGSINDVNSMEIRDDVSGFPALRPFHAESKRHKTIVEKGLDFLRIGNPVPSAKARILDNCLGGLVPQMAP